MVLLRWIVIIVVLFVMILLITNCAGGGRDTASERAAIDTSASRVSFSKKGAVTVTSVESFDKDYYDAAELQQTIDSEVTAYNDAHGGGVSAGDLTVENGTATLEMKYDSAEDYVTFNDQDMFWGTLEEAENAGYDFSGLSGTVNAQDPEESFGEGTARTLAQNRVIVITEPLDILTPSHILYASSCLTIAGSDYATVNGDISETAPAILILQ